MTSRKQQPLHFDPDAERAMAGAALLFPDRLEGLADDLAAADFFDLVLRRIWQAVIELTAEGKTVDRVTVVNRVNAAGAPLEPDTVVELMADALPPRREHVDVILRHSASRRVRQIGTEAVHAISEGGDPYDVATRTATDLDLVGSMSASSRPQAMTLEELIERSAVAAPWVIPGLVRRDWRAIVVAGEGLGKSTLLRQLAIASAQGVHPLTHQPMQPIRALIVDAENPLAAIAETGSPLDAQARRSASAAFDSERCRVWSEPGGLDLRRPRDRASLVREIRNQQPELVVAGPVYKLGPRHEGESYEDAAEGVLRVLDELRTRFKFALILEHHAPKPQAGKRDILPFGSQRWLAWPELGIGLHESDQGGLRIGRFRGDRLRNHWPDRLERSGAWPWTGVWEHGMPSIVDYG